MDKQTLTMKRLCCCTRVAGSRQYWVGELHDRCEHLVEPLQQAVSVAATPHPSLVLAVCQVLVRMTSWQTIEDVTPSAGGDGWTRPACSKVSTSCGLTP